MEILITSQRYWPENFRITDVAEELVKRGHNVTVLTGLPNYPQGYILDDYKKRKNRVQVHNGVKIIRSREFARRNNVLSRFLNYYSFPFFSRKTVRKLKKKFDVVLINNSSPILSSRVGAYYKKIYKTKTVMYEMDLWPESLLAGGVKKDSLIYKHYKKVSIKIYREMDKILVSTKEHVGYINGLPGCSELDVEYLPQYAESLFETIQTKKDAPDVGAGKHVFTFAGYIGTAQNIDVILRAAEMLKERKDIQFDIVGDGKECPRLRKVAAESHLDNVVFFGHRPLEEMPHFYNASDALIVSLENSPYANMTIPGKVQTYLAAGKPVIGSINGATANLIRESGCGIACPAGDAAALAKAVTDICESGQAKYSAAAAAYYREHFLKDSFMTKLLETLEAFSK